MKKLLFIALSLLSVGSVMCVPYTSYDEASLADDPGMGFEADENVYAERPSVLRSTVLAADEAAGDAIVGAANVADSAVVGAGNFLGSII